MKYHITVEETTRTVYEVDASTEREAREKFMRDGGQFVGSETDLQTITEIEAARTEVGNVYQGTGCHC